MHNVYLQLRTYTQYSYLNQQCEIPTFNRGASTQKAYTHLKNCVFLWRKIVHEVLWLHPRCVL